MNISILIKNHYLERIPIEKSPNNALQPTPLRVERNRADFTCYTLIERIPDLSAAARLNASVGRGYTPAFYEW